MSETTTNPDRMPAVYISHGGGPCFFMDWDPPDAWDGLRAALEGIAPSLPRPPRAILVITAHWESADIAIDGGAAPELIYDYGGFPAHTYQLTYPAPGAPDVARRAAGLLEAAGIAHHVEDRGSGPRRVRPAEGHVPRAQRCPSSPCRCVRTWTRPRTWSSAVRCGHCVTRGC